MMKNLFLLACLLASALANNVDREGRLLITTETATVTSTTVLFCFTTEKKLLKKTTQCARKKRAIEVTGIHGNMFVDEEDLRDLIRPSQTSEKSAEEELTPTNDFQGRKARFLYAVTKTEKITEMSYTATTAITFKCTPAETVIPACGSSEGGDKFKDKFNSLLGIG
jgi:hypothetical protein